MNKSYCILIYIITKLIMPEEPKGIKRILSSINVQFENFTLLTAITSRLKIPVSYVVLPFFLVSLILLGTGVVSSKFLVFFGMFYPSFMTIKELQQDNPQKNKKWLIYWMAFGFFTSFSKVIRLCFFFLSFQAYNVFKLLFYLWLFLPKTNGALQLYNLVKIHKE